MIMLVVLEMEELVLVGNKVFKNILLGVWTLLTIVLLVKTFLYPPPPTFIGDTLIIKNGDRVTSIPVSKSIKIEITKE